jgi:Carboxypeptidase Taq (M32) metallopeptidase
MMPSGGASARSMQKSALAGVIYEKRTAPALGELLQQLQGATDSSNGSSSFNKEQLAVIRDAVRDYALETRKSKDMASKESELEGKAYHAWYVHVSIMTAYALLNTYTTACISVYTLYLICEVIHTCMIVLHAVLIYAAVIGFTAFMFFSMWHYSLRSRFDCVSQSRYPACCF